MTSTSASPGRLLQAVLFDMDGTLVDTEPFWISAEIGLVAAHGGTWSEEQGRGLVGRALLDSAAYIREHGPVPLTPPQIVEELLSRVIESARRDVPIRAGVRELIARLRAAAIPRAMVTMSYESLARTVADQLGPGAFEVIVAGDHVDFGKPHPEAYLTAAARLAVDPSRCVAIEDSPIGIASARAAGCVVLAVPNEVRIEADPSYTIVESLAKVDLAYLDNLLRSRH